jgi:hypothetical protein
MVEIRKSQKRIQRVVVTLVKMLERHINEKVGVLVHQTTLISASRKVTSTK